MATLTAAQEVIAHLRHLRACCARGMAWCSALVWAEKAFLLSDDTDDLLWLVDALVTNGQYRQAEEWLENPLYSARCHASAAGRYLASVVAMRLGRAEDALELLSTGIDNLSMRSSQQIGAQPTLTASTVAPAETPTMTKAAKSASAMALDSPLALLSRGAGQGKHGGNLDLGRSESVDANAGHPDVELPPLNPKSWMLYMQGAAVIQISNIGGNENVPSIKSLRTRHPEAASAGLRPFGALASVAEDTDIGSVAMQHRELEPARNLGAMHALVSRLWVEAIRADARCWEAWSGIREYGLLTCEGELKLIASLDWSSYCGGSPAVGQFFKSYCLATLTAFTLSDAAAEATNSLLSTYPQLVRDPSLCTIQAARLLSQGRAMGCLEYTTRVLEYRRVPDPSATAIHITALTVLHARDALFRVAHELAEEFGISSIKRADIEPSDTSIYLPASAATNASSELTTAAGSGSSVSRANIGASVAGVNRVRAGARGLLVPETPSRAGAGAGSVLANADGAGSARRAGAPGGAAGFGARSTAQNSSAAATAAWRGLWGLPTWTHPGPPVLATYPCALGPFQSPPVSTDAAMSTLATFTTTSAQSVGSPTQHEFIGASLAWYAVGCYYLVSASLLAAPNASQSDWLLAGFSYGNELAAGNFGLVDGGHGAGTAHRRGQALSPEAEHALAEARRWLAKTTLASPRSIVAWVAFAHTFVIAGEWESATRALHTAVGLCGFESIVHGGGRDSAKTGSPADTPSKQKGAVGADLFAPSTGSLPEDSMPSERGTRLAHAPLASLGSVYLQMGDLGMAESCFDASVRCLSGHRISEWLAMWSPAIEAIENSSILAWCSEDSPDAEKDYAMSASLVDPQLLNDIGVLCYNSHRLSDARIFFILALRALHVSSRRQHALHAAFNPPQRRSRRHTKSTETRAYSALLKANLGNTLRKLGDYDAALLCLEQAAAHAPSNTNITLSVAFALHLRAIDSFSESAGLPTPDLDRAIDIYHTILSAQPGDPTTTDLLSLALELSASAQTVSLLGDMLDIDREFRLQQTLEPRDPSELGLPGLSRSAAAIFADSNPRGASVAHSSARSSEYSRNSSGSAVGGLAESASRQPSSEASRDTDGSSVDEDSDEAMDIEDGSDSGSDMAMD
ncbi:hypothetical protein GQ54DRAFT_259219 [Martensiomyces pterosporus]|nr:hypothetical protein GQ54DRAFT_259219 [Martensiomyces pterosporus]